MLDNFASGGNLWALEVQGCDGAKWVEMGKPYRVKISLLIDFLNVKQCNSYAISKCNRQLE